MKNLDITLQNRIALVIGNSDYKNTGALKNPVNDANSMDKVLSKMGFTVIKGINLSRKQIEIIQIKAYTSVFLKNYRYKDFIKFAWHYRVGAFSVLKKILGMKKKDMFGDISDPTKRIKLNKNGKEIIISATQSWQKWQVSEQGRALKIKHKQK